MKNVRDYLSEAYIEWRNDYLTPAVFAEHNLLTEEQAKAFLNVAKEVFYSPHPYLGDDV